jgi:sec-independent protein translocase protein TatB
LGIALLVFGPQKLPEIAKQIAKGLRDLRRASDDLRRSINLDDDPPARPRPPLAPARVPGSELTAQNGPPPEPAATADASSSAETGSHEKAPQDLVPVAASDIEPRQPVAPSSAPSMTTGPSKEA